MPRLTVDLIGPDGEPEPVVIDIPLSERNGLLRLHQSEAKHVARTVDLTVKDLYPAAFRDLQPEALSVIIQVGLKRQGRPMKFDDIDFDYGSIDIDAVPDAEDWLSDAADGDGEAVPPEMDPTPPSNGGETEAG